jgi:hypothetical protein
LAPHRRKRHQEQGGLPTWWGVHARQRWPGWRTSGQGDIRNDPPGRLVTAGRLLPQVGRELALAGKQLHGLAAIWAMASADDCLSCCDRPVPLPGFLRWEVCPGALSSHGSCMPRCRPSDTMTPIGQEPPPMRPQARFDSPVHCRGRKTMTARMFSAFTLRALAACSGESANNGCR